MRKLGIAAMILALAVISTACTQYKTDLRAVAQETGMRNITTSDASYPNYTATGQYEAYEWGLAIGIPQPVAYLLGVPHPIKLMEIFPRRSNEDLLRKIATMAAQDGAKEMVDVYPHHDFYTGFPCCLIGFYEDHAIGTGITIR